MTDKICFVCNQEITQDQILRSGVHWCHEEGCNREGCDCDLECHEDCCPDCTKANEKQRRWRDLVPA